MSKKNLKEIKWNNINTNDKTTYPAAEANVLFYKRSNGSVYFGSFRNNKFVAYSTHASIDQKSFYMNELGEYSVNDVDCYINIKDIKPLFNDDINWDAESSEVYSHLVVIKYLIGDMDDFYTIVNTDGVPVEHKDNQQYLRLPKLPDYCFKERIIDGKYVMEFCDDKDGFYTYNIYKKRFFGLFNKIIGIVEMPCRADAYAECVQKFESILEQTDKK